MSMRANIITLWWKAVLPVVCLLAGIQVGRTRGVPFVETVPIEWAIGVYAGKTPFELSPAKGATQPVLTGEDVTDVQATFVADPFIVRKDGKFYLFFEVMNADTRQGDLGYATSSDGLRWRYRRIILDEPFHLSYPQVFEHEGSWYMIPESGDDNTVRLYVAEEFPEKWRYVKTLVRGPYRDPTVFQHNGYWWMFASYGRGHDILRFFYAPKLTGPWREHPQSPVVEGDANLARPAGRVIHYGGKIYRITQDCFPAYGTSVLAFEIVRLTTTEYKEKPMGRNPILGPSGTGWNADGMHHLDVVQREDGTWFAVVDGRGWKRVYGLRY